MRKYGSYGLVSRRDKNFPVVDFTTILNILLEIVDSPRYWSPQMLAEQFNISEPTLYRCLAALRQADIQIRYHRKEPKGYEVTIDERLAKLLVKVRWAQLKFKEPEKPKIEPQILSTRQVAEALGISYGRATRMLKDNIIPSFRKGRQFRVKRGDLEKFKREKDICGGEPVIPGTRTPVHNILELLVYEDDVLRIIRTAYPHLTDGQINSAIMDAAKFLKSLSEERKR